MPFTDKNFNDFLRDFLARIKLELPQNSIRFSDFEQAYESSLIKMEKPNQYVINEKEDLSWIDDFRKIIFHIYRVINDPRATIISYKEPLGVDKVVKIDSTDVMESSKRDSFWNRTPDGVIYPKKFSTSINERNICIYENRFVVFIIDLMLGYVNQTIFRIRKKVRFMSRNFEDEHFSFKDVDNVLNLADFKQFKYKGGRPKISSTPLLTSNKSNVIKNLNALDVLRKELTRITFTNFYNEVKKSGKVTEERVYATNILLFDHDYGEIYNFYYRFLKLRVAPKYKAPIYKPWYNDYVGMSLLIALRDEGFVFNQNRIMFNDVHHFIIQNYKCEKEGIKVDINMEKNCIDLTFNVQYIEGKFHKIPNLANKRINKICLIMHPNPKTKDIVEVKKLYSSLIAKKLESGEYTNAFVVSPHEEFNLSNCIIVSPFASNADLNLKNMIESSLVFVEGDSKMYSRVCPICGSRVDGEWDDGNCHCYECNSVWTTLLSGDNHRYQSTIWLKAIKRAK